jgi:hypothetical protein
VTDCKVCNLDDAKITPESCLTYPTKSQTQKKRVSSKEKRKKKTRKKKGEKWSNFIEIDGFYVCRIDVGAILSIKE